MQIHLVYAMNITRCWSYNYEQKLTTSLVVMTQQGRQMLSLKLHKSGIILKDRITVNVIRKVYNKRI